MIKEKTKKRSKRKGAGAKFSIKTYDIKKCKRCVYLRIIFDE